MLQLYVEHSNAKILIFGMLKFCSTVLRALQGIGAGGMTRLVFILLPDCAPPSDYPLYSATISVFLAIASLLVPILGGLISNRTSWR
jgi:MFS family permease